MPITMRDVPDKRDVIALHDMKAGRIPATVPCPCGGAIYFDRDVEIIETGRIVPLMATCDTCFTTVEVKVHTNGAT